MAATTQAMDIVLMATLAMDTPDMAIMAMAIREATATALDSSMEETNKYSGSCKAKDAAAGKCFGGLARMHRAVSDVRSREGSVLWLNAGDFFQGTIW